MEQEKKKIEGQKKQIEESLAKKRKEAFQLAEATGVSVPHNFEEDFSQKDPFVRHLEESIKEKKSNLECPVCLEVIDSCHLVVTLVSTNVCREYNGYIHIDAIIITRMTAICSIQIFLQLIFFKILIIM